MTNKNPAKRLAGSEPIAPKRPKVNQSRFALATARHQT